MTTPREARDSGACHRPAGSAAALRHGGAPALAVLRLEDARRATPGALPRRRDRRRELSPSPLDMPSDVTNRPQCSQAARCDLSRKLRFEARNVWQTFYCTGNFERCARYQRMLAGADVPPNLLPNGKLLDLSLLSVKS